MELTAKTSKVCSKCGAEKALTLDNFPFRNDGQVYRNECKQCLIAYADKYRKANHERLKAHDRDYYRRNKEKRLAYTNAHYHRNRDKYRKMRRQWNKDNPERHAIQQENNRNAYRISSYGFLPEINQMSKDPYHAARALNRRSGFEVRVTQDLDKKNLPYLYEAYTFPYTIPTEVHKYTPDLALNNGIIVELKGEWTTSDRKKVRIFRETYPDIDYRMVFDNANQRISKQSKTTYAMFCTRLGIPYAHRHIPDSWHSEPINQKSLDCIKGSAL